MLQIKRIHKAVESVINRDAGVVVNRFTPERLMGVEKYFLSTPHGAVKLSLIGVTVNVNARSMSSAGSAASVLVFSTKHGLSILDTEGKDDAIYAVILHEESNEIELLQLETFNNAAVVFHSTNSKETFKP